MISLNVKIYPLPIIQVKLAYDETNSKMTSINYNYLKNNITLEILVYAQAHLYFFKSFIF